MTVLKILVVALYLIQLISAYSINCTSPDGTAVPWFFAYKYPRNVSEDNPRFAYVDSTLLDFVFVDGYVDESDQALSMTIDNINKIFTEDLSLLVWNDEPADEPWVSTGGHSKGILAYDKESQSGVYIVHSAPKFPAVLPDGRINVSLPENTFEYGQHFFCVSFEGKTIDTIVSNLQTIWPIVYYSAGIFNEINFASSEVDVTINTFPLTSGEYVWMLSKNPNYTTGYLYENVIQPYFQINLDVESWGRPYLPPVCPGQSMYTTKNIDYVSFANGDGWDHYSDHSKWAVSANANPGVACACDMNRMSTQIVRGGSCICTKDEILFNALAGLVGAVDYCEDLVEML